MKDHVTLLLLGDERTGKTSAISTYLSRYFSEDVPSVLPEATLTPDNTANGVTLTIIDSSARLGLGGDLELLKNKIKAADCILAVYDMSRTETMDGLEVTWLPLIRDAVGGDGASSNKTVLVVGMKKDLVNEQDTTWLRREEDRLKALLCSFPFVLACYRCSAKQVDVDQIFYEGQQRHSPTHPLTYSPTHLPQSALTHSR